MEICLYLNCSNYYNSQTIWKLYIFFHIKHLQCCFLFCVMMYVLMTACVILLKTVALFIIVARWYSSLHLSFFQVFMEQWMVCSQNGHGTVYKIIWSCFLIWNIRGTILIHGFEKQKVLVLHHVLESWLHQQLIFGFCRTTNMWYGSTSIVLSCQSWR
jgi:hypothetical protein